jgi:hypothetical protein
MNDLDAIAKLAQALFPWRDHLVFIGGLAHLIHRLKLMPKSPSAGYAFQKPFSPRNSGKPESIPMPEPEVITRASASPMSSAASAREL